MVGDVERLLRARSEDSLAASLIRGRRSEVVTLTRSPLVKMPADVAVEPTPAVPASVREEAVLLEIERLRARIERLKRELAARRGDSED